MSPTLLSLPPSAKRILAVVSLQTLVHSNGCTIHLSGFQKTSPNLTVSSLHGCLDLLQERSFTDLQGCYQPILDTWSSDGEFVVCELSKAYLDHLNTVGCLPLGWLNGPILPKVEPPI